MRPIQTALETNGDRIADLHVWSVGPGIFAASISIVTHMPASPESYRERLPADLGIVHATIEIHRCPKDANVQAA